MNRGILFALCSAVCFGCLAILAKLGLAAGMGVFEIIQARFSVGAVLLFAYFGLTRPHLLAVSPRALAKAAALGCLVYPVQSACFIQALELLPASTTSLIYYLYPLAASLWAFVVFKTRPDRAVATALAFGALGCALIFHDALARDLSPAGMAYAVATMLVYSVYLTLIQVVAKKENVRTVGLYVVLFAAISYNVLETPLVFLSRGPEGLAVALGLGLVPTALAVSLVYRAIAEIGSAYAAALSTLEPVTTVLLAALLLGETLTAPQLAGMACIVGGVLWPNARLILRQRRTAGRAD